MRVKSVEQQALQGLHRIPSLWMSTRTSRINVLRGFCREFCLTIPQGGAHRVGGAGGACWPTRALPCRVLIRDSAKLLLEELRLLEARIAQGQRELASAANAARRARCC